MTNETKPKIRELVKHVEFLLDSKYGASQGLPEWVALKQSIKQLRKENKKLKKVLEATEFAFKMKGWGALVSEHVSQLENMWKFDGECFLFTGGGNTPEPKPQAAAHFKCAKTHNPSKEGVYGTIALLSGAICYTSCNWNGHYWLTISDQILAFTETDPQEIINSLSKTK